MSDLNQDIDSRYTYRGDKINKSKLYITKGGRHIIVRSIRCDARNRYYMTIPRVYLSEIVNKGLCQRHDDDFHMKNVRLELNMINQQVMRTLTVDKHMKLKDNGDLQINIDWRPPRNMNREYVKFRLTCGSFVFETDKIFCKVYLPYHKRNHQRRDNNLVLLDNPISQADSSSNYSTPLKDFQSDTEQVTRSMLYRRYNSPDRRTEGVYFDRAYPINPSPSAYYSRNYRETPGDSRMVRRDRVRPNFRPYRSYDLDDFQGSYYFGPK